ncbi:MAG: hypothetical protein D6722_05050 [Bacteroidetes bacterium]|nr:MAG: hypothetical protein D6722_05050 [Bacteroidota bacterium]
MVGVLCLLPIDLWGQVSFPLTYFREGNKRVLIQIKLEEGRNRTSWENRASASLPPICVTEGENPVFRISFGQVTFTDEPDSKHQITIEREHVQLGPGLEWADDSERRFILREGDNRDKGYIYVNVTGAGKGRILFTPRFKIRGYGVNEDQLVSRSNGIGFRYEVRQDEHEWQKALVLERQKSDPDMARAAVRAFRDYLSCFPTGKHANDARQRITMLELEMDFLVEASDWQRAKKNMLIASFQAYIQKYPDGIYIDSARYYINRLNRPVEPEPAPQPVVRVDTGFVSPQERLWREIRAFTRDFPQAADSAYKAFLLRYPDRSLFADSALLEIDMGHSLTRAQDTLIFRYRIRYARLPLRLIAIESNGEQAGSWTTDSTRQAGQVDYVLEDSLLVAHFGPDSSITVQVEQKRNYLLSIRDALGRIHALPVEAGLEPLILRDFKEEDGTISFSITGGRPPYYLRFVPEGQSGVSREEKLGDANTYTFPKSDFSELQGAFAIVLVDERKTEQVTATQMVTFEKWEVPTWAILLLLLLPLSGWLGYHFLVSKPPASHHA